MLEHKRVFSGFSVDDVALARAFYGGTLGLTVTDGPMGNLDLSLGDGASVFIYPKPNHEPASFTILNFVVDDVERAVDGLVAAASRSSTTTCPRWTPRGSSETARDPRSRGSRTRPATSCRSSRAERRRAIRPRPGPAPPACHR